MKPAIDCDQIRQQLALSVGGDLTSVEQAVVDQHLAGCVSCRQDLAGLRSSHAVLQQYREDTMLPVAPSLWPGVQARLSRSRTRVSRAGISEPQFGRAGWIPVSALAAACVAVLVLSEMNPSFNPPGGGAITRSTPGNAEAVELGPVEWHGGLNRVSDGGLERVRSMHYSDTTTY